MKCFYFILFSEKKNYKYAYDRNSNVYFFSYKIINLNELTFNIKFHIVIKTFYWTL